MKLHSLEPRNLGSGPIIVIVDDLSKPYDLSHFDSASTFSEQLEGLELASTDRIVGVNLDVPTLSALWDAASAAGCKRIGYWVDSDGEPDFLAAVGSLNTLAIDGTTLVGDGVLFGVTEAVAMDRPSADFLRGFFIGRKLHPVTVPLNAPVNVGDRPSGRRADLLAGLFRLAKPLKPFLPAPVIHAGYRVLGAFK